MTLKNQSFFIYMLLAFVVIGCKNKTSEIKNTSATSSENQQKPNIVFIYTDDLGYGDVSAYGAKEIKTPAIDALAEGGILFKNAYATAATCTPSRYSVLTGNYAWRKKGTSVAKGDQGLLIDTNRTTLPKVLKQAGYKTGIVGKWHLGLGGANGPDWNGKISPGPLEIGFDYSYLIPATGDRVPCVFVENHHIVNLDPNDPIQVNYKEKVGDWPTGKENPELLTMKPSQGHNHTIVNGISRIGYMTGGKAALWDDETIPMELVDKSNKFINKNKEQPFFLLLSTHDIHVPRVANKMFQGKSGMGPRGDVILQLDWTVNEIVKTLKAQNLLENTIVIFSSDNGPVVDDGYHDQARELLGDHKPTGGLRGGKYSAYDGGSKIPLIIRWPEVKNKGMVSDALVSQVDFLKSFATMVGIEKLDDDVIDSQNQLDVLKGESTKGRTALIQESFMGPLSYLEGDWKYIEPLDGPELVPWGPIIETGFEKVPQLYNIEDDPNEKNNLASKFPVKVKKMKEKLANLKKDGFSNQHEVNLN
ncbi:sulfatase family protein [Hwangdonia lutea]|uniref:Arylsulfatase n=1 Tax=Hwangdonia lutea TaxID=3075823 RepID=A0AA97EMM8_9FLAO|nr:arylsulfatase [Hwangdonia sp. SCSIO 19198]WOD42880.1 arylsulfatase [Hwangdonia sp. SCSIO 19198]